MTSVSCSEIARPIALGRFDLDDFGPVNPEQHRAIGRSDALPKVEHAQATIRRVVRWRDLSFDCQCVSPSLITARSGLIRKSKSMVLSRLEFSCKRDHFSAPMPGHPRLSRCWTVRTWMPGFPGAADETWSNVAPFARAAVAWASSRLRARSLEQEDQADCDGLAPSIMRRKRRQSWHRHSISIPTLNGRSVGSQIRRRS
jgi:hypothetical protein